MKTKSSAKKRFKITGSGKIKRKHAFKNHILTAKQAVAMRLQQFDTIVPTQMAKATKELYDKVEALGVTTIEEDRFPDGELETNIKPFVGIEKPLSAGLLNPGITKT